MELLKRIGLVIAFTIPPLLVTFLTLLFASFLFNGCTDVTHSAKPDVYYKRDAKLSYGGRDYLGVAILPRAATYRLQFSFSGDLDLFTLRTCHREITQEEFGGGGIFNRKQKQVEITYEPQPGIESGTYCPVEIGGYDAEKGRHSWGFIDFEGPTETLSGLVKCNGIRQVFNGVSVCQSLEGLAQEIVFPVDARFAPSECLSPETKDNRTFRIYPPKGRCIYVFREMGGDGRFHRLTTIGYESILVRKVL